MYSFKNYQVAKINSGHAVLHLYDKRFKHNGA